jgi:hypothetical protein
MTALFAWIPSMKLLIHKNKLLSQKNQRQKTYKKSGFIEKKKKITIADKTK